MPSDLAFWRTELERAQRVTEQYFPKWQENLDYYTGTPLKSQPVGDYVNVNVDVYQVEQKTPQLFFENPELQMVPGVGFEAMTPGILAHRAVINALVSADRMDGLTTIQKAIKDCTCTAGRGATVLGYQPTIQQVPGAPAMPAQPGAVLGIEQQPAPMIPVPIHEAWFWDRIPSKKFFAPADFTDTDFDKAPWLRLDFRVPLTVARQMCNLPADFTGTMTKDDKVLESGSQNTEATTMAYVDGSLVWYKAALFDDDVLHPEIYRRHVVITGLDTFADQDDPLWQSPYQTIGPDGRLTPDSLIGNPIHVLTLRDVPDSQFPPSDAQLTRPLVKELCLFRTQMVNERDTNKPKFGYNVDVFPQDAIDKVVAAMTGSLIPLPGAAFAGGLEKNFATLAQGTSPRQTYLANDYIERDIQKTLGIGANQAGVSDKQTDTATEAGLINQALAVRLDADRKRVLRWYLKAVDKISALALRFLTDPKRVAELIGPQGAQAWLQWRQMLLATGDARPTFTAKADSQLHLDAKEERKYWLQVYNFAAKDPLVNRAAILKKLFLLSGEDPQMFVADKLPDHKPEPSLGYSFKGDDVNPLMPQFPIVLELLAQLGLQISPQAIQEAQVGAHNQMLAQMAITQMTPTSASAKPATKTPAAHGGTADKMGPLSKNSADQTGERSGPKIQ